METAKTTNVSKGNILVAPIRNMPDGGRAARTGSRPVAAGQWENDILAAEPTGGSAQTVSNTGCSAAGTGL